MPQTPPLTGQDIAEAQGAVRAVLDTALARTGTTSNGYVVPIPRRGAGGLVPGPGPRRVGGGGVAVPGWQLGHQARGGVSGIPGHNAALAIVGDL
jgi:hypothetical protein